MCYLGDGNNNIIDAVVGGIADGFGGVFSGNAPNVALGPVLDAVATLLKGPIRSAIANRRSEIRRKSDNSQVEPSLISTPQKRENLPAFARLPPGEPNFIPVGKGSAGANSPRAKYEFIPLQQRGGNPPNNNNNNNAPVPLPRVDLAGEYEYTDDQNALSSISEPVVTVPEEVYNRLRNHNKPVVQDDDILIINDHIIKSDDPHIVDVLNRFEQSHLFGKYDGQPMAIKIVPGLPMTLPKQHKVRVPGDVIYVPPINNGGGNQPQPHQTPHQNRNPPPPRPKKHIQNNNSNKRPPVNQAPRPRPHPPSGHNQGYQGERPQQPQLHRPQQLGPQNQQRPQRPPLVGQRPQQGPPQQRPQNQQGPQQPPRRPQQGQRPFNPQRPHPSVRRPVQGPERPPVGSPYYIPPAGQTGPQGQIPPVGQTGPQGQLPPVGQTGPQGPPNNNVIDVDDSANEFSVNNEVVIQPPINNANTFVHLGNNKDKPPRRPITQVSQQAPIEPGGPRGAFRPPPPPRRPLPNTNTYRPERPQHVTNNVNVRPNPIITNVNNRPRPNPNVRPNNNVEPTVNNRPNPNIRPNTNVRPNVEVEPPVNYRPNPNVRPIPNAGPTGNVRPNVVRPDTAVRPEVNIRPNPNLRPNVNIRPDPAVSPAVNVEPNPNVVPTQTTPTRPQSVFGEKEQPVRRPQPRPPKVSSLPRRPPQPPRRPRPTAITPSIPGQNDRKDGPIRPQRPPFTRPNNLLQRPQPTTTERNRPPPRRPTRPLLPRPGSQQPQKYTPIDKPSNGPDRKENPHKARKPTAVEVDPSFSSGTRSTTTRTPRPQETRRPIRPNIEYQGWYTEGDSAPPLQASSGSSSILDYTVSEKEAPKTTTYANEWSTYNAEQEANFKPQKKPPTINTNFEREWTVRDEVIEPSRPLVQLSHTRPYPSRADDNWASYTVKTSLNSVAGSGRGKGTVEAIDNRPPPPKARPDYQSPPPRPTRPTYGVTDVPTRPTRPTRPTSNTNRPTRPTNNNSRLPVRPYRPSSTSRRPIEPTNPTVPFEDTTLPIVGSRPGRPGRPGTVEPVVRPPRPGDIYARPEGTRPRPLHNRPTFSPQRPSSFPPRPPFRHQDTEGPIELEGSYQPNKRPERERPPFRPSGIEPDVGTFININPSSRL